MERIVQSLDTDCSTGEVTLAEGLGFDRVEYYLAARSLRSEAESSLQGWRRNYQALYSSYQALYRHYRD